MKKSLPFGLKVLVFSLLPLLAITLAFFLVTKFGLNRVSSLKTKISQLEKEQKTLSQKLNTLRTLGTEALEMANTSLMALPDKNPSLTLISQLKNASFQKGVFLANIKAGTEVKDKIGLSRVDISFDAEGPKSQVIEFLKEIEKLAPITLIEKVRYSETAGVSRASINISSFWAELPKKLPLLSEPLADLTSQERQVLVDISDLVRPAFETISPSEPVERSDPFD